MIVGAIAAVAVAVVVGGVWAGRRYIPALLAPPPPPPKPALPMPLPNQVTPEAAKPAPKKKGSHKKHGGAGTSSAPAEQTPAAGDEASPPSDTR